MTILRALILSQPPSATTSNWKNSGATDFISVPNYKALADAFSPNTTKTRMIRFLDQNLQLDISVSETNIKLRNVTSVTCELHNTRSRAIVPPRLNQLISTLCELPLAIPTTHLLVTTTFLRVAPTLYYQVVVHNMTFPLYLTVKLEGSCRSFK